MNPILVLLIVFVVTLILGVPFAWSLLLASAASVCMIDGLPLMQIASKMYNGGAKNTLLAIFFFMLAGAIMQHGGISSRMIMFAKACVGHLRGGLSIVVLLVCMLFAALSGSSIATTAAIGAMLYPELVKENYPKGYAAALPVAGGTLGIVIPPSIVFVVYGSTTGTSVSKLLMSGVIPGIMAGVFMCIYAYLYARKHDIPKSNDFSWANVGKSLKEAIWAILINMAGHHYSGHTEIYADYTHTAKYSMMLAHDELRVIHVSTHVSLRQACDLCKKERVLDVIRIANEGCKALGIKEPKIGVAGLNPHCGENGMFGREEIEEIQPAIDEALAEGINIPEKAPTPPDTVFSKALGGWYDIVVVMYHDQGHIPLKVKGFVYNKELKKWDAVAGVNVTLGLPIIRASVDHGTGEGHAGDGSANELSLVNAMDYAIRMANAKKEKEVEA